MSYESATGLGAPIIRAEVSPSLTKEGLSKLTALLASFHRRYPKGYGDLSRFEFLLDEMFEVFLSLNVETRASGESSDCFPLPDNFDTAMPASNRSPRSWREYRKHSVTSTPTASTSGRALLKGCRRP